MKRAVPHTWDVRVGDYTVCVHYAQHEDETHYAAKVKAARALCASIMSQVGIRPRSGRKFSAEVLNLRAGRLERA
jgi:hypothetical protein